MQKGANTVADCSCVPFSTSSRLNIIANDFNSQDEAIRNLSSDSLLVTVVKNVLYGCTEELDGRPVNLTSESKRVFVTDCMRNQIEVICTASGNRQRASVVAKARITTLPATEPTSTQQGK